MSYVRLKLLQHLPVSIGTVFGDGDAEDAQAAYPCLVKYGDGGKRFIVLVCGDDGRGAYGYNLMYAVNSESGWLRWVFPSEGKKGEWTADADPSGSLEAALAYETRIMEIVRTASPEEAEALRDGSLFLRGASVDFGRYRGRTVGEIIDNDYGYFLWMTKQEDFLGRILRRETTL